MQCMITSIGIREVIGDGEIVWKMLMYEANHRFG